MKRLLRFAAVEEFVVRDENFLFTLASFAMILVIFLNQILTFSMVVGVVASGVFILINVAFLGHALFEGQIPFVRFMLGALVLLQLLGIIGWCVMIAYSLDAVGSTLTLCTLAGCSSLVNKLKKR